MSTQFDVSPFSGRVGPANDGRSETIVKPSAGLAIPVPATFNFERTDAISAFAIHGATQWDGGAGIHHN
jgi:hypothetical protein